MSGTGYDYMRYTVADGFTAAAGGGQATATPLTINPNPLRSTGLCGVSVVTTVATAGDSILLPVGGSGYAKVGTTIQVVNEGANAMQVFGSGLDTVNGAVATTGLSQPAGTAAFYTLIRYTQSTGVGAWRRNLTA